MDSIWLDLFWRECHEYIKKVFFNQSGVRYFYNLNFLLSDTIQFLDKNLTVFRHVAGENAVLCVEYDTPPDHCLPLEFTW